jgi:hypothetical protein
VPTACTHLDCFVLCMSRLQLPLAHIATADTHTHTHLDTLNTTHDNTTHPPPIAHTPNQSDCPLRPELPEPLSAEDAAAVDDEVRARLRVCVCVCVCAYVCVPAAALK